MTKSSAPPKPGHKRRLTRRNFILTGLLTAPLAAGADACWLEPGWLKTEKLRLAAGEPKHRFVHFTDLHHKGDREYGETLVKKINDLSPDFVCFTGDLIEESKYLPETLEILSGIKSPLFGVPGNHDYWSKISFAPVNDCFATTGGGWLMDENRLIADGSINLIGLSCENARQLELPVVSGAKNIVLMHYPAWVKRLGTQKLDLMLAGHSHGGQIRIPFYGPIALPFGVDEYDLGLFHTDCGPLYVNPGIGWFPVGIRFRCRPEITLIEI